jgi:outer membrane protein assembly factor BamB
MTTRPTRRAFIAIAALLLAMPVAVRGDDAAKPAPGKNRPLLIADYSKKRIAIIGADGETQWEHRIRDIHDLHMLDNGNVLFQDSWTHIVEMNPKTNEVIWEYDSAKRNGNEGKAVEVHAFQRLPDGVTMIAESGPARIIEVDRDGKIVHQIKMKVANPHPHRDTRLVRKLDNGHYLVCHEAEGAVREYDGDGKVVWEYEVPLFGKPPRGGHGLEAFGNAVFAAVRLKNGNTLIATGNGHSVIEVTPAPGNEIVWKIDQHDLPGVALAWVTTLQVLPNGNIVIGNCHAGPANPQLVEVTRDKKVVWTFKDFERFGDATSNSQVLGVEGSIR